MSNGLKHRAGNDPRAASLFALSAVMRGADSQAALDKVLDGANLAPSDKALATELFYGTLRYHLRLEWFLKQKLASPERLPGEMLLLLEQSVYELAHTRIPAHAVVNWAAGLTLGRFGQGLARVANGVLRSIERGKQDEYFNLAWYAERLSKAPDSPECEALRFALPEWLPRLWRKSYAPETYKALLETSLQAARPGLRLNLKRHGANEVIDLITECGAEKLPPAAWILPQKARLPISVWIKNGLASRQSVAAYAALFALKPEDWPQPLWDACAGRGGKTLALLERGIAVRCASDTSEGRIRGLREDYARLGPDLPPLPDLVTAPAQEAAFAASCAGKPRFRTVLADAPCSGLGTLAHRPEIRWRRTTEDIARLAETQSEILEAAHRALIPESGSLIVYMTCTMTRAENQDQSSAFLARHPEYEPALEYETPAGSAYGEFFYAALLRRM